MSVAGKSHCRGQRPDLAASLVDRRRIRLELEIPGVAVSRTDRADEFGIPVAGPGPPRSRRLGCRDDVGVVVVEQVVLELAERVLPGGARMPAWPQVEPSKMLFIASTSTLR